MTTKQEDKSAFTLIRATADDAEAFVINPIWVMFKQQLLSKIMVAEEKLNDPYQPNEVQKWFLGQIALLKELKLFVKLIQEATKFDEDEGFTPTPEDDVEQIEVKIDNQLFNEEMKEDN